MTTNDNLRGRFLAWLPTFWNRNTFIDSDGDEVFIEDWVQGAWIGYCAALAEPDSGEVVQGDAFAWAREIDLDEDVLFVSRYRYDKTGYTMPLFLWPKPCVIPERKLYTKYLGGVVPVNRLEAEAHTDGWNACLDEFEALNKAPTKAEPECRHFRWTSDGKVSSCDACGIRRDEPGVKS